MEEAQRLYVEQSQLAERLRRFHGAVGYLGRRARRGRECDGGDRLL